MVGTVTVLVIQTYWTDGQCKTYLTVQKHLVGRSFDTSWNCPNANVKRGWVVCRRNGR